MLNFLAAFELVCLLSTVDSFLVVHKAPRNVTKILSVDNGGRFGTWQTPHFCAEGAYAVGFDLKVRGCDLTCFIFKVETTFFFL